MGLEARAETIKQPGGMILMPEVAEPIPPGREIYSQLIPLFDPFTY